MNTVGAGMTPPLSNGEETLLKPMDPVESEKITVEGEMNSSGTSGEETPEFPSFIRLSNPPPFDVNKHLPFIKSQLPADQFANLEKALDYDQDLFAKSHNRATDLILDCNNEESFTLETFESLLKAARSANKDFILARVTTLDPTGPKPQIFHSHYSAHHLNKILFRTQPEEGLLHRMKSRNPLNNMLIVGDVDYFVVRPADYDTAQERFRMMQTSQEINRSKALGIDVTMNMSDEDLQKMSSSVEELNRINAEMTEMVKEAFGLNKKDEGKSTVIDIPMEAGTTKPSLFLDAQKQPSSGLFGLLRRKSKKFPMKNSVESSPNIAKCEDVAKITSSTPPLHPEPLLISDNANIVSDLSAIKRSNSLDSLLSLKNGEPAVLFESHFFATDDDFLMRSDVREYFKENSVNPDDYLLFTLYRNAMSGVGGEGPYMTEIPTTGFTTVPVPAGQNLPPPPRQRTWKNLWGLIYPPSPSLATTRTGFYSRTAYKYSLLLYIIACILVIKFLIPLPLMYIVGFGMFMAMLIFTVFFVECNPRPNSRLSRWNMFTARERQTQLQERANISSSHLVSSNDANNNTNNGNNTSNSNNNSNTSTTEINPTSTTALNDPADNYV